MKNKLLWFGCRLTSSSSSGLFQKASNAILASHILTINQLKVRLVIMCTSHPMNNNKKEWQQEL